MADEAPIKLGRPPLPADRRRVALHALVDPETMDALTRLVKITSKSKGKLLDAAIKNMLRKNSRK